MNQPSNLTGQFSDFHWNFGSRAKRRRNGLRPMRFVFGNSIGAQELVVGVGIILDQLAQPMLHLGQVLF